MKYSIVVPIYNVEKYIIDCLKSIYSTGLEEFNCECILVDDGSNDLSKDLALDFIKNKKNFRYFFKDNGGLSDARNYGLSKSLGEYIIFIDSDDVVSKYLLEYLDTILKQEKVDMVYLNYNKFVDLKKNLMVSNQAKKELIDYDKINKESLATKPNFSWLRVVKKEFYDNLKFPKGYLYEDVYVSPILLSKVKSIVELRNEVYFYRKRAGSITTNSICNQLKVFDTLDKLKQDHPTITGDSYFITFLSNLIKSILINICRQEKGESTNYGIRRLNNLVKENTMTSSSRSYILYLTWKALGNYKLISFIVTVIKPIVYIYDNRNIKIGG